MILDSEQTLIRDTAKQYAREHIKPFAAEWDRNKIFPQDALQGLAELGFFGMLVPEDYDGANIGYVNAANVIEQIAWGDAATSTIISVTNSVACMPILHFGSEAQKQQFLKPLASGQHLGAFCLSEPHAGTNAVDIKTKAVRDGDHYVINGVKQFITSGKHADIAIVIAATDPSQGSKGISAFIVPTKTPGYEVTRIEDKLGQHASDTCQITFTNCRIPADQLLGEAGQGYKIALSQLEGGRIGIAAQSVGIAQAAFDDALTYAKEREAFGQPLIKQQSIANLLADMATQIQAARLLTHQAAVLKDQQQPALQAASMAKLFAATMAEKVCSDAIHIHGGYGYLNDFAVERYYRDVKVCQIYEGTNEVQRMVIARSL